MSLIDDLKWRYATKKMDPTRKIPEGDLQYIKEAVRLAASSYGLQPYVVLDVTNRDLREKLRPLCWNQSQITDASHVFVFCNYVEAGDDVVDQYVALKAKTQKVDEASFAGYGDFVKKKIAEKTADEAFHWTAKQAYIAMTNAMSACAELKIDSTPMEGFLPEKVNEALGLPERGLNACVILAMGYRASDDGTQHNKKVRKSLTDLFVEL